MYITYSEIIYYVIHVKEHIDRYENIENIKKILNKNINIFDAINGSKLNINKNEIYYNLSINHGYKLDLHKNNKININYLKKIINRSEIAIYLSHYLLYKQIIDVNDSNLKFSIIFEDDVMFDDDLDSKILEILNNIDLDFDILFLGNLENNHGENYKNNIFYVNSNGLLTGTHAYIINNKNINKIYNNLFDLDIEVDNKYKYLIDNKKLIGLVIYPCIAFQNKNYKSTVNRKVYHNNILYKLKKSFKHK